MKTIAYSLLITLIYVVTFPSTFADKLNDHSETDNWFEEDIEEKIRQVNEGKLNFIENPPVQNHKHSLLNLITITKSSIRTHWVEFRQCHKNLDPVAQSQIVYQYKHMRNLNIEFYKNIGKAWVEGQSIQLQDIAQKAEFCATAQVKILNPQNNKTLLLRNGPYYRKFLDGYYPFHVELIIKYPQTLLKVKNISPTSQPGFSVKSAHNELNINTWFEGELIIEIVFMILGTDHD